MTKWQCGIDFIKRMCKALKLPEELRVSGIAIEGTCDGFPIATITTIVTGDQLDEIHEICKQYEMREIIDDGTAADS